MKSIRSLLIALFAFASSSAQLQPSDTMHQLAAVATQSATNSPLTHRGR